MRRTALLLALVLGFVVTSSAAGTPKSSAPELRALWVDGFHPGIWTADQAEQLVAAAKRGGFNTLIVQVRRRGDALYLKSFEPYVEDVPHDPAFDPLANIIEVAHRNGIEVHAWINAAPVWRDQAPPHDLAHVFNQHGPHASGDDMWLTADMSGNVKFPVGYFLDIGNPAAADYIARVYLNILRNYAVDGIHFDYIRYPETDGQPLPSGADVGYNPTSLARFRRATGMNAMPAPNDQRWTEWRRQQVTQLVRRVYIEAKAINPKIKVSAAVISWGRPPVSEQDFENVSPMQRIFQNWHGWLREGILDLAVPMNYNAESRPQVRDWFNGWIDFEKRHQHGRQIAPGLGAYLNTQPEVLAQISRVRQPSHGRRAPGLSLYSYGGLYKRTDTGGLASPPGTSSPRPEVPPLERVSFLSSSAPQPVLSGVERRPGSEESVRAPFATQAAIPPLPWIDSPTRGFIAGTLKRADGTPIDSGTVRVRRTSWFASTQRVLTDGNGIFGLANLKPGTYRVQSGEHGKATKVTVTAGAVARAELSE